MSAEDLRPVVEGRPGGQHHTSPSGLAFSQSQVVGQPGPGSDLAACLSVKLGYLGAPLCLSGKWP